MKFLIHLYYLFVSFLLLFIIVVIKGYYNDYFGNTIEVENIETHDVLTTIEISDVLTTIPEVINKINTINYDTINFKFEEFDFKWRPMGKPYPYCNYNLFELKQVELYFGYLDHLELLNESVSVTESQNAAAQNPAAQNPELSSSEVEKIIKDFFEDNNDNNSVSSNDSGLSATTVIFF